MANKASKKKNTKAKVVEKKPKTKEKPQKFLESPTAIKHKRVLKYMEEKGCSMKEALRACGYSKAVQNSPQKVTRTESWKQLLDRVLPESKLIDVHEKQLQSWKLQSMNFQKAVEDEVIFELMEKVGCVVQKIIEIPIGKIVFYIQPDNQSRNKALELGLKLHKRLTDKVEVVDKTPYSGLSDAELAERINKNKNFFRKK